MSPLLSYTLIFGSGVFFFALYPLLRRAPLPFMENPRALYEWYHTIGYSLIATNTVVAIGSMQNPFAFHHAIQSDVTWTCMGIQTAFLVAGIMLWLTKQTPQITSSLLHHAGFGVAIFLGLYFERLPVGIVWMACIQFTGIFFHPTRLVALADQPDERLHAALDRTHALVFIGVRVIGGSAICMAFLFGHYSSPVTPSIFWSSIHHASIALFIGLHLSWFRHAVAPLRDWMQRPSTNAVAS